ncbi:MAG: hypothetical protein JNM07_01215 [Phycisphaerae bacterium]|nr:hypothetical protein [Phycisphaerae bacterium]
MNNEAKLDRARDAGFNLINRLLSGKTGCAEGMRRFLAWADGKPGGSWRRLQRVDWSPDLAPSAAWFTDELRRRTPPPDLRGLWFSVPEIELNPADLEWCGCPAFDAKDEELAWTHEPLRSGPYPDTPVAYRLRALDAARTLIGFAGGYNERAAARESLVVYLLPLAYTSLLMREILASLPASIWGTKAGPKGAVAGFAGGDWVRIPTP